MADDTQANLTLNLNVDAHLAHLKRNIKRVIQRVSLGLKAISEFPDGLVGMDDVFPSLVIDEPPVSNTESRADFRTWILAVGLNEGVDRLLQFVEESIVLVKVARAGATGTLRVPHACTAGEVVSVLRGEHLKGTPRTLPDRLCLLADEFKIGSAVTRNIVSINQARNCLVHRGGVVGPEDVRSDSARKTLRITYSAIELSSENSAGRLRALSKGEIVEAGLGVVVRRVERDRSFDLGATVDFTPQEFHDVASTICWAGDVIYEDIKKYASSIGVLNAAS